MKARRTDVRTSPRTDRDGFSLIELLVVMMILAVGILPVAVVQHQARREVVKADLGGNTGIVYRLRAGPLPNRAASKKLCGELSGRGVGCFIVALPKTTAKSAAKPKTKAKADAKKAAEPKADVKKAAEPKAEPKADIDQTVKPATEKSEG